MFITARFFFLIAIAFLLYGATAAEAVKIGVISMQRGLNETGEGKQELEKLKKIQMASNEALKQKQDEIKVLEEEINKQGFMLSNDKRLQKEEQFRKLQRDFERYREDKMAEFVQQRNTSTASVFKKFYEVLKEYVKAEKFDIIMESGQASAATGGAVIYASTEIDITEKVIELYNKKYPIK